MIVLYPDHWEEEAFVDYKMSMNIFEEEIKNPIGFVHFKDQNEKDTAQLELDL